ncbi:c-type cytochrome [Thiohalorhabdus sp.]|uniref:c-type cytochrome n=1 Tax=Thiohalorhabdus sp. TaxID=3094134 RepID=UPI002FC2C9A3
MRKAVAIGAIGLGAALLSASAAGAGDGKAAAQDLGCTACHAAQTKLVGPSYQAVSEKYGADQGSILERIKMAVENGASGTWSATTGGTPMPPQPQAAGKTDKLETIAAWIAAMAD